MNSVWVAERAHGLTDNSREFLKKIRPLLVEMNELKQKITGFGGWGIFAVLAATVVAGLTYHRLGDHLPALLNEPVTGHDVVLGVLVAIIAYSLIFYGIGLLIARKLYGQKLEDAQWRLRDMVYNSPHQGTGVLQALVFMNEFEPGLLEALDKETRELVTKTQRLVKSRN